jgi:hypothetical protein
METTWFSELWLAFNGLHGVIFQNIEMYLIVVLHLGLQATLDITTGKASRLETANHYVPLHYAVY